MKTSLFFFVFFFFLSSCQENPLGGKPKAGADFHPGLGGRPILLSISPSQGPTIGGTNITITGKNFTPNVIVRIDGVNCASQTYVSPVQLLCLTPAGPLGAKTVSVSDIQNLTSSLSNSFEYINNATGPAGFGVVSGGAKSASPSLSLNSTMGESVNGQVMTGPTMQMRVGVQGILFQP